MTRAIEPELLVFDDPATGLDPAARRSLLEAMIHFTRSRQRTIFFSSHLLESPGWAKDDRLDPSAGLIGMGDVALPQGFEGQFGGSTSRKSVGRSWRSS